MMGKWFGLTVLVLLAGLSYVALSYDESTHPLAAYGMEDASLEKTVAFLENTSFEPEELQAGLNGTELTVSNAEGSLSMAMPEDRFYASIAPYYDSTHPCGDHNLVTCQGELDEEPFEVVIKDGDGNTVFADSVQSEPNGFFGLWLPRDLQGTIEIQHGDSVAIGSIQTFDDSDTCYTDYQLN